MQTATRVISTRRGAFVLSALAAVLAGAMILVYVERYRASVQSEGAPVTVLVAGQAIPKGTAGGAIAKNELYTTSTIRQSRLREGAFSDPSSLRGKVATTDIYAGAQLTAADFGPASGSLTAQLGAEERVISLPLDSAHGLIGQVQVGDHVDVYAGFSVIPLDARGIPIAGGQARPVLKRIITDVPVVAMSGKGSGISSGGGTTNVDLKVDDRQAAELAFASDNGKIWLSLRPSSGAVSTAPGVVTIETVLLGVPPVQVLRSFGGHR